MDDPIINAVIKTYFVEERIKAGGVAVVYKAINQETGRTVAIKVLQTSWAEHEEVINRFEREARIMSQLQHPHIVEFLDYGVYQGRPYIVMDYMESGSLSERLKQVSQISLGGTAQLLRQIASALDYAHSQSVIHRDLKPGNILLRGDRHASLTDFGIARVLEHTMLTMSGHMPGTPHYMSPEQARGAVELNHLSDLYSLAVIAYLLSTGGLPFTGTDPLVIINQHLSATPPLPSIINPQLPRELDDVLLKGLEKNPAERYPSAGAFSKAYEQACRNHEKTTVVLIRAPQLNLPVGPGIELDTKVFSSKALPLSSPSPATRVLNHGEIETPPPRQQRLVLWLLASLVLLFALVLGIDAINSNLNNNVRGTEEGPSVAVMEFVTPDDIIPEDTQEVVAADDTLTATSTQTETATPTSTETPTPTVNRTLTAIADARATATEAVIRETAVAQALTATATLWTNTPTPSNTPTATWTEIPPTPTPTPSNTPTDTPTATSTSTPTATLTLRPTNTPTAPGVSAPLSPTVTPSITRTPTPFFASLTVLLDELSNNVGTASRFNCTTFVAAYNYLVLQLGRENPEFLPAQSLVDNQEAPMRLIYEDYCQDNPEETRAFITFSLFGDMRRAIEEIR